MNFKSPVAFFILVLLSPGNPSERFFTPARAPAEALGAPVGEDRLASHPAPPQDEPPGSLVERVGQTGFLQLYAESFHDLTLKNKILAYWLSMAAIAIHPIVFDQNSAYGLEEKHLLAEILKRPRGIDPGVFKRIVDYTKLFWANRGNHDAFTGSKFVPQFTSEELQAAALEALKSGARLGSRSMLQRELEDLKKPLFDADFEPMLTVKNPPRDADPLASSAENFYQNVSLIDLKGFQEKYPLNSRLVKQNGKLIEQVYRAGTPDGKLPPGLYAAELVRANNYLAHALPYAGPSQKKVILDLIRYYRTGSPADWRQFNIDWVSDNSPVDFTNGFIEVYKDPRGLKGAAQAFVTVVDQKMNRLMQSFAQNAAYFEQRAPWEDRYKLEKPNPPLANAAEALIETGDFDVGTIGENLPNEAEIHEKFGSKSFIFTGSSRALSSATGSKVVEEFAYSREEIERAHKYFQLAEDLFTAMHEVIGHGSGKLNPRLTEEPAVYIKEYYSTLEETRADLMALWNFFDPKLIEMGVLPDLEVARAAYDAEARAAVAQLREVPAGDTIEEDHRRGTQLIVNFIRDKTGAIEPPQRDGKVYMVVKDYEKMRQGAGMLLAELMRIKAEGDYDAARALITKYGIHFNTAWRDQVVERYRKLDLPLRWTGINPDLKPKFSAKGISDVEMLYPRDIVRQQLRYSEIAGN